MMVATEKTDSFDLFDEIYLHIIKPWNLGNVFSFRKNVPPYLQKIFLLKFNKTVDGFFFNKKFDKFDISVIKDENPINDFITNTGIYTDTVLINGRVNIIVVINEDKILYQEDKDDIDELSCIIGEVCKIFKYVISSVEKFYPSEKGSLLFRQFAYAPLVMTFKLIVSSYIHKELGPELIMKKYFNIYSRNQYVKSISVDNIKSCYSYNVFELLDKLGIIFIVDDLEDRFKELIEVENE